MKHIEGSFRFCYQHLLAVTNNPAYMLKKPNLINSLFFRGFPRTSFCKPFVPIFKVVLVFTEKIMTNFMHSRTDGCVRIQKEEKWQDIKTTQWLSLLKISSVWLLCLCHIHYSPVYGCKNFWIWHSITDLKIYIYNTIYN